MRSGPSALARSRAESLPSRRRAEIQGCSCAAAALSETLTRERLIQLPDLLETTLRYLDQNCNLTLLVTWFCARLRTAAGR